MILNLAVDIFQHDFWTINKTWHKDQKPLMQLDLTIDVSLFDRVDAFWQNRWLYQGSSLFQLWHKKKTFLSPILKNYAAKLRMRLDSSFSHCLKNTWKSLTFTLFPNKKIASFFKYFWRENANTKITLQTEKNQVRLF